MKSRARATPILTTRLYFCKRSANEFTLALAQANLRSLTAQPTACVN